MFDGKKPPSILAWFLNHLETGRIEFTDKKIEKTVRAARPSVKGTGKSIIMGTGGEISKKSFKELWEK